MSFGYWKEGLVFIFLVLVVLSVPCIGVAMLGYKMINKLGYFPSKTPAIQMSIFIQLVLIEIFSFALLIGFFKIFSLDE